MTTKTTKTTKTSNIAPTMAKIPQIAVIYNEMIDFEDNMQQSVTNFVQEFKGADLQQFDAKNLQLHQWENWKFRSKNGIKCGKSATDKPKTTATKLSVIRTFLKYNNKIDKNTTYEICKQFQASLKNLELSPEQIAKDKIKKSLKGLSVEQLNEINAFISQI
jgi:hypothetical protein